MRRFGCKKIFVLFMTLILGVMGGRMALFRSQTATQTVWNAIRLSDCQIILDAGHGGEDGGALSVTGVPESQINLAITKKLDHLLGLYGVSPILLRESDISLHDENARTIREKKVSDLHNRVSIIQGTEQATVVSIHQNTFPDPSLHGCQVFYRAEGESKVLAERVQAAIRKYLDEGNRRKVAKLPTSVYLMEHITCPAILVECGFLSNPEEEAKLRTGDYQIKVAACIASGLLTDPTDGKSLSQN